MSFLTLCLPNRVGVCASEFFAFGIYVLWYVCLVALFYLLLGGVVIV